MRKYRAILASVAFIQISAATASDDALSASCTMASYERDFDATRAACDARLASALSDSDRADALLVRGRSLRRLGKLDAAIDDLKASIAIESKAASHISLGGAYSDNGESEQALREANRAKKLDPSASSAWDLAGAMLMAMREFDQAKAQFDEAVKLDPTGNYIRFHRYEWFNFMRRHAEAVAELDVLLAQPVEQTTRKSETILYEARPATFRTAATLAKARALMMLGRLDDTRKAMDSAVQEAPGVLTYTWRAIFKLEGQAGSLPDIQSDLDEAVKDDANYGLTYDTQGKVHFYADRYQESELAFERASTLEPQAGGPRWWRAMALRKLGHTDDAIASALAALHHDPGYIIKFKLQSLSRRGYLAQITGNADPTVAFEDAIRACLLDEGCG